MIIQDIIPPEKKLQKRITKEQVLLKMENKKFSNMYLEKIISFLLIFQIVFGMFVPYITIPQKAQAVSGSWTQTSWAGGSGQSSWSDATMYNSVTGEGIYDSTSLRMKINADVVVGQSDFTSSAANQGGGIGANTLKSPAAYTDGTKLFVADVNNHRVLIYNTIPTSNNASADVVIGQADFTGGAINQGGSVAANTLNLPFAVYTIGGKLFIADGNNNRILIYNTIPTSNDASADVVIGQADFTGGAINQGGSVAANTLDYPFAMYSDGTKFVVADRRNHRVLIYNTIPTSNDASADVVIGQLDFASNTANQGGSVAANTINYVDGVYGDGTKLFVADNQNHRVLIYNTIPTSNDASADVVIGQADFVSNSEDRGGDPAANTSSGPQILHFDGSRLVVAEWSNNRFLVYNSIPTTNGVSADAVIGQPDFIQAVANQGESATAYSINTPIASSGNSDYLITSDWGNNRALIHNLTPVTTTFISSAYDAGTVQEFGPITWTEDVPDNTSLTVEVSVDSGVTWTAVTNGQSYIGKGQTIQYRTTLSNTDGISTPTLSDITINFKTNANPTAFSISSHSDNQTISNPLPTLSWSASSDDESGLAKYQLYIDSSLDTDDIGSGVTSIAPTNPLSCGVHTWFVRATDNAGNYTDSSTLNLSLNCGRGLPVSAHNSPVEPEITEENPQGGFKISINNEAESTNSQEITIKSFASSDTKRMAISEDSTFKNASQEEFVLTKQYTLLEGDGIKTVYVKFYTQYGVSSETVSDSILLKTVSIDEEDKEQQQENKEADKTSDIEVESTPDIKLDTKEAFQPSPVAFTQNLQVGSKSSQTIQLQNRLKELNFFPEDVVSNGNFGPTTKKAVQEYQKTKDIYPNGIFGPRTRKALNSEEFITNKDHQFTQDLKHNDKNEEVEQLQTRLRDQNFFPYNVSSTGWFGPITQNSVNIFKKFHSLVPDGIVDKLMRDLLNK
ncbi:MAG: peptidoglycan-binding protein [Candidatus Pacebacteria bacterium]|nr:peptidoglycan-binding protein [Candidatus Paceibacterota bacterium]